MQQINRLLATTIILMVLAGSINGSGLPGKITSGLLARWPLDEAAGTAVTDASGNGYDLKSTSASVNQPGVFGTSYDFSSGYANRTGVIIQANADKSICMWLKPTTNVTSVVVGNQGADSQNNWAIGPVGNTGGLYSRIQCKNTTTSAFSPSTPDASTILVLNQWTHLCMSQDFTANNMKMYLNGSLSSTTAMASNMGTSTNPLYLGSGYGLTNNWKGYIDEVELFDRVLLDSEIQDLYQAGTPCPTPVAGMNWQPNCSCSYSGFNVKLGNVTISGTGTLLIENSNITVQNDFALPAGCNLAILPNSVIAQYVP